MGYLSNEQTLIEQNNLPSRRWKIKRIRTAYDKKLRQLDKKHTRVQKQIRDLGYEEIYPPIQRGYKRLFALTEETKYSKEADFYQRILDKINTTWYSPHKIFRQRKRKISKWNDRLNNEQVLQTPDSWNFHNTKKFTQEEKYFFHPVEYYDTPCRKYRIKYIFIEPWRFRLRVMPNMITHIQIKDFELEQYRDELSDFLDENKNRKRLVKMYGGNTYSWKKVINERESRKKYKYNSLRNIPLYKIKEQYEEEKLWEYDLKN